MGWRVVLVVHIGGSGFGVDMKLYLYTDFKSAAWAKNPAHWREMTGETIGKVCVRAAHKDWPLPKGFHRPNGHLANDAIERIPTMSNIEKGKLIIAGLRKATCKYCGKPGVTLLCRCKPHMTLLHRNWRDDTNPLILAGPMGKLP